jgi:hypothetical protein
MDLKRRLTKKSITIREMIAISYDYYRKHDNKEWRARVDILNARLIRRHNFSYNKTKQEWEQTGRECKFAFAVKSDPVSYKRTDKIKIHTYPVVFIIKDVSKGVDSPFKWRTGSLVKPRFTKPGMSKEQKQKIQEYNIRNNIQLDFFFKVEWIAKQYDLLYGINWAQWAPKITNPDMNPYLDKTAWYCVSKILVPFRGKSGLRLRQLWKNE